MDAICQQMSSMNVSEEMLLNIDTWTKNHIDHMGIYNELITPSQVYKVYTDGKVVASRSRIKNIKLIQKNEDIYVVKIF